MNSAHEIQRAMDLLPSETLRCFITLSKLLNFRKAATEMHLSPAAFGQRIKQLEDSLGHELFLRTTREVSLTQEGLRLLPYAEKALRTLQECHQAIDGTLPEASFDLTLGTRHELGFSWILPNLKRIEQRFPHAQVHLYFGSGADLLLRVAGKDIDCAITSSRITDPKLDSINLHEEHYTFVGASKLIAKTPLKKKEDASAHTLLDTTLDLPLFSYIKDAGLDGIKFAAVRRMGTIQAIKHVILQGQGVGVLPSYFVEQEIKKKKLIPLMPNIKAKSDYFRLVFRKQDPKSSFYERLATELKMHPLT